MTWVIRKNSNVHYALQTMRLGPKSLTEIKRMINYKKSIEAFQSEIMNVLSNGGFIKRRDERFYITERGDMTLVDYGAPKKPVKHPVIQIEGPNYRGLELTVSVQRQGADDHMQYPSRRGNKLFFRDGRVQDV
jgi:hypothetical protein